MYYVVSIATMAILIVAANTSYADFPRLASFIAGDDFMPHQFKDRGYRLVHSTGIVVLTTAAGLLLVVFGGDTTRLIPLYAIGVFTSFTLSQSGMVVHWWKYREAGVALEHRRQRLRRGVPRSSSRSSSRPRSSPSGAWIVLHHHPGPHRAVPLRAPALRRRFG